MMTTETKPPPIDPAVLEKFKADVTDKYADIEVRFERHEISDEAAIGEFSEWLEARLVEELGRIAANIIVATIAAELHLKPFGADLGIGTMFHTGGVVRPGK